MSHFYERLADGVIQPRHFVPMTSRPDELRPTRVSDVRKWWKEGRTVTPSVTTVLNVLAKDALVNWKIDQHLSIAYGCRNTDQTHFLSADDWITEVKRLTELEMDKAPSAGSDMHKAMQDYLNIVRPFPQENLLELCTKVMGVIEEKVGTVSPGYKDEVSFVSDLGYGGQADLVIDDCTIKDKWIIDYKTKQSKDKFKPGKMAYDDHHMQLSAYREGSELPKARCANVFICLEDGQIDFHEHTEDELNNGWEMFTAALKIWQLQNGWRTRR